MTPKPPAPIPDDSEAERRFNETLGRLVNTPHKPHKPVGKDRLTESPDSKGKDRN